MGVYTKQSAILFGHGKVQGTKNPWACLEQVSNEKSLSTIFSNHILVMRTHSTGSPTKDRPTEHSTIAKADCPFDDNEEHKENRIHRSVWFGNGGDFGNCSRKRKDWRFNDRNGRRRTSAAIVNSIVASSIFFVVVEKRRPVLSFPSREPKLCQAIITPTANTLMT